jgi:PAS domain S-box-containing protein
MKIRIPSRASAFWPWVGLALALSITAGGWWVVREDERTRLQALFEEAVAARVTMISQRLATEEQILKGAAEFVAQKGTVTRPEWRGYVAALDLPRRYPGIQGLGFTQWIAPGGLESHERWARADGWPSYRVKPWANLPSDPAGAGPVVFLEPVNERNERALGLDVWSEPVRREALIRARDQGDVAATGRLSLVQEDASDPQSGIVLYAPVYRQAARLDSAADRRRALIGWTNLPLRMDDHMRGIYGQLPAGLLLQVREEGTPELEPLFPSSPSLRVESLRSWQGAQLVHAKVLEVAGRHWVIQAQADGRFMASRGGLAHWGFLAAGALVSLLIFMLLRSLSQSESRAMRLAEQRLQQLTSSERRWQFALEGSGEGLWDWDVLTEKVSYSPRWKAMLDYGDEEIGDSLLEWKSRVHPEDLDATLEALRKHLAAETSAYQSEYRLRGKGGGYKWILDRGLVVDRAEDGRATRMIGTHTDLTEHRNAEALRRRVEKAESLGLMAGGIAHDFNNLFQALLGNLELAQLRSDAPVRQILERARVVLDKAAGLSRRMLEFSGGGITVPERLPLEQVVREAVQSAPQKDGLRFQLDLTPSLAEVIADPQQVRQILDILIENAVESIAPEGGIVVVASEQLSELPEEERTSGLWEGAMPQGPLVRLSVSDTGGGVRPEALTRLFDPFFTTKALGRGLGLPSALGLIRGNHAGLQVLNRPGEGMTFRIHFAVERRTEPRSIAPVDSASGAGRAVLLVDDEADLRQVLAEALRERHGCRVFEAADGLEAFEVFRAHREGIGLVLMDCEMPRLRGPESFDQMRQLRPDLPGILMSGFGQETSHELAARHGFLAFIKKPFRLQEVSSLMAELAPGIGGTGAAQEPADSLPRDL